jgi:hypothetical protein
LVIKFLFFVLDIGPPKHLDGLRTMREVLVLFPFSLSSYHEKRFELGLMYDSLRGHRSRSISPEFQEHLYGVVRFILEKAFICTLLIVLDFGDRTTTIINASDVVVPGCWK